jgi:hypothetical protein
MGREIESRQDMCKGGSFKSMVTCALCVFIYNAMSSSINLYIFDQTYNRIFWIKC